MLEKKSRLTGLVLSFNGERILGDCLASLSFCDEILVVDSGSTDASLTIAQAHGARIVSRSWEGFASQFSFAQGLVETEWFFILDQDEICSPQLAKQIRDEIELADAREFVESQSLCCFELGRRSWYFDRFLRHSGWYPDFILRVFRTGYVEFYEDAHIHYRALGPVKRIQGQEAELIHYPYTSFYHQLSKLNSYAEAGAKSLKERSSKGSIWRALGHGLGRFVRIYVLKRGFLDGRAGFLVAVHGAFYAFSKYIRVLEASWGKPYKK